MRTMARNALQDQMAKVYLDFIAGIMENQK